jgi:hypothetical protein
MTDIDYANLTPEEKIAFLEAERDALKAAKAKTNAVKLKITDKGGVSFYGVGRFPVTLYDSQWLVLLENAEKIREFLDTNRDSLSHKV